MDGEEKLFYTIGETAQIIGVKPYVLRYWESEFKRLNPQKSESGQRTYRKKDLQVALTIRRLLYEEQYTIAGALKKLEELSDANQLDPFQGSTRSAEETGEPKQDFEPTPSLPDSLMDPSPNEAPVISISPEKIREFRLLLSASREIFQKHNV